MINKLSILFLIVSFSFLAIVLWLTLVPVKVVEFKNANNLKVLTPRVKAGDNVKFLIEFKKFKDLKGVSVRTLRCPTTFDDLPVTTGKQAPIGEDSIEVTIPIPLGVVPSKDCKVNIFLEYQVNPFHKESYTISTHKFEVVNPLYDK